ncbi:hypothetical protein H6F78_14520 [Coleofasciculus sp. FACHB-64]|nr:MULTISPECIES: hypothetical protein [unclassified Coleofasciculus]MBD1836855.1 hypothetical protein [Coleofasciculus sp. FACHB-501]MBD2046794.1 hypothetical protein [Coleofasciculus sp. FACHB-64]
MKSQKRRTPTSFICHPWFVRIARSLWRMPQVSGYSLWRMPQVSGYSL